MTQEPILDPRLRWVRALATFCAVTLLLYGVIFMIPTWRTPTPHLAAITPLPDGLTVMFDHTEEAPFWNDRIVVVRDEFGRTSEEVINLLRAHLTQRGWDVGAKTAGGPRPDDYCIGFGTAAEFVAEILGGAEYASRFTNAGIRGDAVVLSMGAGC